MILWPPNSLVLAALIRTDWRKWWVLLLATVLTEVAADVPTYPVLAALGYGLVNFLEGALAALLLTKTVKVRIPFADPSDFSWFLLVGPLISAGIAALAGALIYKLGSQEVSYLHYWRVFWLGDAVGLLVVGTALLSWRTGPTQAGAALSRLLLEGILLAAGTAATILVALRWDDDASVAYGFFPFLIWSAMRFGVRGAALAVTAVSAIVVISTLRGVGPFAHMFDVDLVLGLQGLIAVVSVSTYMLAFATERTKVANRELLQSNAALETLNRELDDKVAERTVMLSKALQQNQVLLKEVHHRVRNNLQMVSALLSAHRRGVTDPELLEKFASMHSQIGAIVAAYDILQEMESVSEADFSQIAPRLGSHIEKASGGLARIDVGLEGVARVSADAAVALSLAVNELATNSIKQASDRGAIEISIRGKSHNGHLVIQIADNGPGFPEDFDINATSGFGIRMVRRLVDQVGGSIRLVPADHGAVIQVAVPTISNQPQPYS